MPVVSNDSTILLDEVVVTRKKQVDLSGISLWDV